MKLRNLRENEIEVRPQQINAYMNKVYANFLLYITARTSINLLNETFGLNWKKEHYFMNDCNGNSYLVCRISVYNHELQEWIYREDVGTESNTEKEKGIFSDSFKRALVNFGLTELYTAPNISITLNENEYYSKNNKFYVKAGVSFRVKEISYSLDREIVKLEIVDNNNIVRFSYDRELESLLNELIEYSESLSIPVEKLEKSVKKKFNKSLKQLNKEEIEEIIHIYNEKEK